MQAQDIGRHFPITTPRRRGPTLAVFAAFWLAVLAAALLVGLQHQAPPAHAIQVPQATTAGPPEGATRDYDNQPPFPPDPSSPTLVP